MKKSIAKKWVDALRSGDYKQGEGTLRDSDNDSFCCLGVLCNLHAQAHPYLARYETDPGVYMGHTDFLPEEVMKWSGMMSVEGYPSVHNDITLEGKTFVNLIDVNDSGVSFRKIAAWIENNYEKL